MENSHFFPPDLRRETSSMARPFQLAHAHTSIPYRIVIIIIIILYFYELKKKYFIEKDYRQSPIDIFDFMVHIILNLFCGDPLASTKKCIFIHVIIITIIHM